jgi:hypothetical protein
MGLFKATLGGLFKRLPNDFLQGYIGELFRGYLVGYLGGYYLGIT